MSPCAPASNRMAAASAGDRRVGAVRDCWPLPSGFERLERVVSELPLILYSAPCHFYDAFGDAVRFLDANYDLVHPARLLVS